MDNRIVIAVDVGGTSVKAGIVDLRGGLLARVVRPTPAGDPDAAVALIVDLADELCRAAREAGGRPAGIGVVVPGRVDTERGVAVYSANLGWRDAPIGRLLTERTGVPAAVGHDVTAGGMAQMRFGGHDPRDAANAVVVQLGTGVAGLLVCDGRILHGAAGLAGEIGHVPVFPGGELCPCGQRGCLERYASAAAIGRRYAARGGDPSATAKEIVGLRATDPVAARVWQEAAQALALGIASVTMLLDPQLVVFTGGLSAAGDDLVEPVRRALADTIVWRPVPQVVASAFGPQVGVAGAALYGWQAAGLEAPRTWQA